MTAVERAKARLRKLKRKRSRAVKRWNRRVQNARRAIRRAKRRASDARWGGSRYYTNRIIRIVNGRARVTSRKRWATFGNPGSDHHRSQTLADAVDFAIADAHWLKNEISRRLGGPDPCPDYHRFYVERGGRTYRVQLIAGTHGTGPHLHAGVRRVA